jgi:hypothetical protein
MAVVPHVRVREASPVLATQLALASRDRPLEEPLGRTA